MRTFRQEHNICPFCESDARTVFMPTDEPEWEAYPGCDRYLCEHCDLFYPALVAESKERERIYARTLKGTP